jgi:hypothetical protein
MKKIKMTTPQGHQTTIEVEDDCITTIKQCFQDYDPFLVTFKNKTLWINPENIYVAEIENNMEEME